MKQQQLVLLPATYSGFTPYNCGLKYVSSAVTHRAVLCVQSVLQVRYGVVTGSLQRIVSSCVILYKATKQSLLVPSQINSSLHLHKRSNNSGNRLSDSYNLEIRDGDVPVTIALVFHAFWKQIMQYCV